MPVRRGLGTIFLTGIDSACCPSVVSCVSSARGSLGVKHPQTDIPSDQWPEAHLCLTVLHLELENSFALCTLTHGISRTVVISKGRVRMLLEMHGF